MNFSSENWQSWAIALGLIAFGVLFVWAKKRFPLQRLMAEAEANAKARYEESKAKQEEPAKDLMRDRQKVLTAAHRAWRLKDQNEIDRELETIFSGNFDPTQDIVLSTDLVDDPKVVQAMQELGLTIDDMFYSPPSSHARDLQIYDAMMQTPLIQVMYNLRDRVRHAVDPSSMNSSMKYFVEACSTTLVPDKFIVPLLLSNKPSDEDAKEFIGVALSNFDNMPKLGEVESKSVIDACEDKHESLKINISGYGEYFNRLHLGEGKVAIVSAKISRAPWIIKLKLGQASRKITAPMGNSRFGISRRHFLNMPAVTTQAMQAVEDLGDHQVKQYKYRSGGCLNLEYRKGNQVVLISDAQAFFFNIDDFSDVLPVSLASALMENAELKSGVGFVEIHLDGYHIKWFYNTSFNAAKTKE